MCPIAATPIGCVKSAISGVSASATFYVAMQRFAPGKDIGFDLGAEYEQAKSMFDAAG
jgi:hypothetical protein